MKPISTSTHGILDVVVPMGLMLAPKMFGFSDNKRASQVPRMMAASHLMYSAFTDYEKGLVRRIPMRGHLALDAASAVFLAASPWILGFKGRIIAPHVAAGLMELSVAMATEKEPRA